MNRSSLVRALFAFLILAASTYTVLTAKPELGLDLRGGTQIVLEASDSPTVKANQETTDKALEVLRRRIDALGVSEPSVTRQGERRIIVELPGVQDPREAAKVIGKTAQLTFHQVLDQVAQKPAKLTAGELYLPSDDGAGLLRLAKPAMTGEKVSGADGLIDPAQAAQGWFVQMDFKDDGGKIWADITGKAACEPVGSPQRRVAIVLDNEVITAPQVDPNGGSQLCNVGIGGGTSTITGSFTEEEAKDLAALIEGGSLPVPVQVIDQRVVGPSLGKDAIQASALAGIIGVALTALFITIVYRLVGLMAVFGLIAYAGLSYAALTALGATLTLPGLAGFVLAIGMAVDANVLVFERAREDYIGGRTDGLRRSLRSGFQNALSAIADSNVTTLLAAGLLFFLAAGPVRGFGVTLSIGVLASMLSALVVTRVLAEFAVSRKFVLNHPGISGIAGHGRVRTWLEAKRPHVDEAQLLRWLIITAVAIVVSLAGVGIRGLNLGIEFTGGRLLEVSTAQQITPDQARAAVAEAGYPNAVVQASGTDDITVRTSTISDDEAEKIRESISRIGGGTELVRNESIGPSLGSELRDKALIALGVALLAQLAYLAVRFRWTFGAGAVLALLQNVAVVVGVFAWTGKPVDGIFLAALLTIIGYTVNDSVVVFDRIRETRNARSTEALGPVVDTAIVNVLPRTINTGISTLFILAALLLLGGDSLGDFALALLLGILVGTYSSNLTAAPLLVELEKRYPAPPPRPKVKQRDRDAEPDRGAVV